MLWLFVNIVCSSHCLSCIRLGETLVTSFQTALWCVCLLAHSQKIATSTYMFANTHPLFKKNSFNTEICKCTQVNRQTGHDNTWHPVAVDSCEAPFLPRAGSKTTTKTVTGNDRPCQQPYRSSWPHQAGRTHAHGHRETLHYATLHNANTIYLLISNQHFCSLFFSFIFFSLHLWVFPKSHVGLIWLIALPNIHRATGSGEIEENKSWENMSLTFEFTLWVHISFLHSTRSSICLPPSVSISPSVSLSFYLGLFSCI